MRTEKIFCHTNLSTVFLAGNWYDAMWIYPFGITPVDPTKSYIMVLIKHRMTYISYREFKTRFYTNQQVRKRKLQQLYNVD